MLAGGLLPWQKIHPDAEAWYRTDFRFVPDEFFWRTGVLPVGLSVVALAVRHLRGQRVKLRIGLGAVLASLSTAVWLLTAATYMKSEQVTRGGPIPNGFDESMIPWVGYFVALVSVPLLLLVGIGLIWSRDRNGAHK